MSSPASEAFGGQGRRSLQRQGEGGALIFHDAARLEAKAGDETSSARHSRTPNCVAAQDTG